MFELARPKGLEIFYCNRTKAMQDTKVLGPGTYAWRVPQNIRMVAWWGCGGGGGGGGGCSGLQDTQRGGGAGGSGGNVGSGFIPAIFLPETIFIKIGPGGIGGGPDTNGTSGGAIYASFEEISTVGEVQSTFLAIGGGAAGLAGTIAAGGTSSPSGSTNPGWYGTDFSNGHYVGYGGSAGGTTGIGTQITLSTGDIRPGAGTGGAGCAATYAAADGGSINVGNIDQTNGNRPGGVGAVGGGGAGLDGYTIWMHQNPFALQLRSIGATGGGNSNTGTGGNGGQGVGFGAGGGGGGAGVTGGIGGRGGDGILLISYW